MFSKDKGDIFELLIGRKITLLCREQFQQYIEKSK
jgi:hypothetical protein